MLWDSLTVEQDRCFIPKITAEDCPSCKECFPLCPKSYLQTEFVLTEVRRSIFDSVEKELLTRKFLTEQVSIL